MRRKKTGHQPMHLSWMVAFLAAAFSMLSQGSQAQQKMSAFDSSYMHKNNIKVNLSPYIFYNNVFVMSYERSLSPKRSFSVTGGVLRFPAFNFLNIKDVDFRSENSHSGFIIGGDYRFYLSKENKYAAPHGVYLGPYISFLKFDNSRDAVYTDSAGNQSSLQLGSQIMLFNVGVQLGYQFVLWNRMTIDLVLLAPSLTAYTVNLDLAGNIDPDHAAMINSDVLEALRNRFPLLDKLISDGSVKANGTTHSRNSVWAPGFKYSICVGYRFGK